MSETGPHASDGRGARGAPEVRAEDDADDDHQDFGKHAQSHAVNIGSSA